MELECLGASGEVGRSAFLLHTDKKIMMDYGIKLFDESGTAKFPVESIDPDMVVLSHAHLDHSGCLPMLSKYRWYATPPTRDIVDVLWKDSMKIMGEGLPYTLADYKRALKKWTPLLYEQTIRTGETEVTLHDAGHISGAAMVDIEYQGKRVFYTGDFKCQDTFMHKGADYYEDIDILILESTYANREHPKRSDTDQILMDNVYETIDNGGNILLPSFALGRTQELIATIRNYDKEIPVFVDGMGREITRIYLDHPRYIRDAKAFRRAVKSVRMVSGIPDKKSATREPSIIISSAGMMNGGPILNYMFHSNAQSKLIFTGYCVEETNGWLLQHKGYIIRDEEELHVDLPWEYLDFSAHAGRADLLNFIKHANPEKIILVHGDDTQGFATELNEAFGYNAIAPKEGERIRI
ncbi:MBL fold metallo-hydrolase [Candidatus Micrarchaeota archaeon]|nr:MBL fold metallo-hydrolase [Candidatus Micrarchaeota archaeon]